MLKVSRTPKNGEISYEEAAKMPQTEVIINTTPVGMYPNTEEIPIDVSVFPNLCGAVDAIYNPLRTSFVLKAGETSTAAGGLYMLVAQAAAAAELFTGRSKSSTHTKQFCGKRSTSCSSVCPRRARAPWGE